jgi:hypothetical protein
MTSRERYDKFVNQHLTMDGYCTLTSFDTWKEAERQAFDLAASERADAEKDAALDALKRAERFIVNGTEFGYIRMPDAPDPALDTLPAIRRAIAILAAKEKKS